MRWLVIVFSLFFAASAIGNMVIPGDDFPDKDFTEFCDVLIDPVGDKSVTEVISATNNSAWMRCQEQSLSRGYSGEAVWLRFLFDHRHAENQTIYIHLPAPWISDIGVYTQIDDGTFITKRYGSALPFKQRPIQSSGFFIPIELKQGQENLVYLRAYSRGAVTVGGQVLSERGMARKNLANTLFIGFLIGGISLLTVFSFSAYILLRDKNYLNYVLYSLSVLVLCGTIYGYNYQFLWPEFVEFNFEMNSISSGFLVILLLVFTRRFLSVPELSPRADKGLLLLAGLSFIGVLFSFIGFNYTLVIAYNTAMATAVLGYVVFLGLLAWRRRIAAAGYFLIAWSASISGMALCAALVQGALEYSDFYFYALGVGVLVEMSLLSIALAGRIRFLQEEKNHAQTTLANNLARSQQMLEQKVEERTAELEEAKREAELLARTDPLTGLNNRRAFFDLGEMIGRQRQTSVPRYAVAMIDIDHFKVINDTYGHAVGDCALKAVAEAIKLNMRDADIVGRIGGEEFAIILPSTNVEGATRLAERLRKAIAEIGISCGTETITFTTSIGVAECGLDDVSLENTLNEADKALYCAKKDGRDRVYDSRNLIAI